MIGHALSSTGHDFLIGLVAASLIYLGCVLFVTRRQRDRVAALLDIERRGHERGPRL